MDNLERHVEWIVGWLRQQVQETKTNGLIVGISGGVDSAVVSFLIKRAFPDQSLGVIMPCHSSEADREEALKVVEACGIEHLLVDLSETHALLLKALETQLSTKQNQRIQIGQVAEGNLRARLRMSTLYTVSNYYNYLVVGTDNAAEWFTGYFTKYGDGGVDLQPLVHLPKRDVYRWASYLGVPESVIERRPSAGLWAGQDDETEMGTTYDRIDDFLSDMQVPETDRIKIETMHRTTAHKRSIPRTPPPFPD